MIWRQVDDDDERPMIIGKLDDDERVNSELGGDTNDYIIAILIALMGYYFVHLKIFI